MAEGPHKRHRPEAPSLLGAHSVIASEPALLQLIAGFIPSDSEAALGDAKQHVVLKTITSLCRAIPSASRSLGPENETFWRRLVLSHFDFTVGPYAYNVEDVHAIGTENLPQEYCDEEEREDLDDEDWATWCRHPLKAALDAWKEVNPDGEWGEFYAEDYSEWSSLGIRFRPSQYDFLHEAQEEFQDDELLEDIEWPDSESAFHLFSELVNLQELLRPRLVGFRALSESIDDVTPVLLSPYHDPVTEGHDAKMLEHCGYMPLYWHTGDGLSKRWTGLDTPLASVNVTIDHNRSDFASKEESFVFPDSSAEDFVKLRRFVHDTMDDWRIILVNPSNTTGAVMYMGRSKASHRWMGLVGQCFW